MKKKEQARTINWQRLLLELFVVFLGVTSGFLLNNWRESQRDHQLEHRYLESFVQDIDSNIISLKEIIVEDSVMLQSLNGELNILDSVDIPQDSVFLLINMILYVSKLDLQTSTFEDIKYSGNLNLIRNFELKGKIVSYNDLLEGAKYVDGYYNRYFSEMMLPFILENYSLSENRFFKSNHESLRRFFNIAAGYYSMRMQRREVLKDVVSESEMLKKDLQKYLGHIL